ncbi:hypothetical protein VPH35_065284 [Triticum aestivum]
MCSPALAGGRRGTESTAARGGVPPGGWDREAREKEERRLGLCFFFYFKKDRGFNTANCRDCFAKFLIETFSHLRKDCGLNTEKCREVSAKMPRRTTRSDPWFISR